jgi:ADP-ribose pyrophosphatase YjhB (NUDIX family)
MNQTSREYPERPLVAVGVVLFRPTGSGGEVLLVQRGRPPAEGRWSFPGGAQRLGETAEAAARRELLEETGLIAGALHLAAHADSIHRDSVGHIQFHYTIINFCGVSCGGQALAASDAAAISWADVKQLEPYALSGPVRDIIDTEWRRLTQAWATP